MVHFTTRQIRLVTEQTFIWAHLRKVFGALHSLPPSRTDRSTGQSLIEQPVIRAKFVLALSSPCLTTNQVRRNVCQVRRCSGSARVHQCVPSHPPSSTNSFLSVSESVVLLPAVVGAPLTRVAVDQMTYAQQSVHLAGPIALLKTYVTRIAHDIADDSVQIWGGRGLTKGRSSLSSHPSSRLGSLLISSGGMGGMIEAFARGYKFDAILGGSEEILAQLGVRQASRKMRPSAL